MKILHTADWHLGNTFHGHDRADEHRHFLNWLLQTLRMEMPDALLIAGDVFDSSNPPAAAEEMFYNFLLEATQSVRGLQIVVVSGNHDSAARLDAPARLLKFHNVYIRGIVRREEDSEQVDFDHLVLPLGNRLTNEAEVVCVALPFLRAADCPAGASTQEGLAHFFEKTLQRIKKSDYRHLPVIGVAHFYASGAEINDEEHSERLVVGGQECVDVAALGKGFCYVALGHIHKAQHVPCPHSQIHYSGSALPMSFSERRYVHGVQKVIISPDGSVQQTRLEYVPLRKLMSIPAEGAASAAEVMEALSQLPQRQKNDAGTDWPYLEIKVEERQPEPTLMHDVAQELEEKAVRFCRMLRVLPEAKQTAATHSQTALTFKAITPLEMAERIFENRYHEAFPEELLSRFKEAEEWAVTNE